MTTIFAGRARLEAGWAENVRLSFAEGEISDIERDTKLAAGDLSVDTLLPALSNLHSHSFQRAMAGMTEHRAAGRDSFWTWRTLMYRFLDHISPDQIQAIAALTFTEMQEAGYAAVGEFHYVHHQPGGGAYDDIGELSHQIAAAAESTGIGLTHLPVFYRYGGADRKPLAGGAKRFGNGPDAFHKLMESARTAVKALPADARVGVAPHSMRAVAPEDLAMLGDFDPARIHMHIAEQPKEVEEISEWLGARPVEWLLANQNIDDKWCLIHCTHMTPAETENLAKSGAVAGLCPITESNLGDGIFEGVDFLGHGGAFGVGSDSNIRISVNEELRTMEYSQRLRDISRNVLADGEGSVGENLYLKAAAGSAQAMARDAGTIRVGALADLVAIDSSSPALVGLRADQLLDGFVFAAGEGVVTDVWSAGRHMVRGGRHKSRDKIIAAYAKAVKDLTDAI